MSVKQDLDELQQVNLEISRLLKSIKNLRETKRVLEGRISAFLEAEDIPAVKDKSKGVIAVLNKRPQRVFDKPKKEREQEAIGILTQAGIRNPQEIYEKIKDVGRNEVEKKVLRINRL